MIPVPKIVCFEIFSCPTLQSGKGKIRNCHKNHEDKALRPLCICNHALSLQAFGTFTKYYNIVILKRHFWPEYTKNDLSC